MEKKSDVRPPATRQLALNRYLEGLGVRAIGHVEIEVVEVDKMHTYVGQKKLPTALDCRPSFRKRFISFVCGDCSIQTGLKLG